MAAGAWDAPALTAGQVATVSRPRPALVDGQCRPLAPKHHTLRQAPTLCSASPQATWDGRLGPQK